MRVMAQMSMVMNLDKCIGCHTCTVTCKQVWTNRPGTEYVYFNNVETKPGVGYPKRYEDQEQWHGGWALDRKGRLQLKAGGRLRKLLTIFYNPDLPTIDDYGDPWTYDYQTLIQAPLGTRNPSAHSISALTGKDMKVNWGSNFEDDLAGAARAGDDRPEPGRAAGQGQDGVRAGVHVLPAAHLRALPQPVLRRVLPLGGDVQARGGRHRPGRPGQVPGLADVRLGLPVQEGLLQPPHRQGREVHLLLPRIEAGQPTICSETCVGRLRYLGLILYDADKVLDAAATPDEQDLYEAQMSVFLDPEDPQVQAAAAEQGIPEDWMQAARRSPIYQLAVRHRVALPLHPEYRTLPMVWYIPPLSPVSDIVHADRLRRC